MANGIHANYSKIGLALVAGAAAAVAVLIWLGGVGFGNEKFIVETYSTVPVTGLSVGSAVNFRGVKIGEVRRIGFIGSEYDDVPEADWQTVYIEMALDRNLMELDPDESAEALFASLIARNLHSTISPSGITGMSRIELNFPKVEVTDAPISWKPLHCCVPPAPSIIESFSDSARRVLSQLDKVDLKAVGSNISEISSSAAKLVTGANDILEAERAKIDRALYNIELATENFNELVELLKENPSLLVRERAIDPLPETAR